MVGRGLERSAWSYDADESARGRKHEKRTSDEFRSADHDDGLGDPKKCQASQNGLIGSIKSVGPKDHDHYIDKPCSNFSSGRRTHDASYYGQLDIVGERSLENINLHVRLT